VRRGTGRAASDISAPGDPCRPREHRPRVVLRFNSRSNREMHGRMVGSRLERTFFVFSGCDLQECRFGRRPERNKTWHCHGAAKAASELKMTRARGPAVPSLV
jgi:hypothetical protein